MSRKFSEQRHNAIDSMTACSFRYASRVTRYRFLPTTKVTKGTKGKNEWPSLLRANANEPVAHRNPAAGGGGCRARDILPLKGPGATDRPDFHHHSAFPSAGVISCRTAIS